MELKQAPNPIDGASTARQIAVNLFYGWGYNFYRKENQARADDLLIRGKVSDLLGHARQHLAQLEAAYRREHLKPPTRENPLPDAGALETARALNRAQQSVEAIEVAIRSAPVPEMDRATQRHRNELDTLQALRDLDLDMVTAAVAFDQEVGALTDAASAADRVSALLQASALNTVCARRAEILSVLKA